MIVVVRAWSEVLDVDLSADAVLRRVSDAAVRVAGARVSEVSGELVSIEERRRPTWAFWMALALFPFGLPALLHKRRTRLVVSVGDRREDHLQVKVDGTATEQLSYTIGRILGYEPDLILEGGSIGRLDDAVYFVFRFVPSTDRTRLVAMFYFIGVGVAFATISIWPIALGISLAGYLAVIVPLKRWERSRQAAEDRQAITLA